MAIASKSYLSLYFANRARKSIGYSSLSSAFWTRDSHSSTGYLGVYKVVYKKEKRVNRACSYSLKMLQAEGCDALFAEKGADLVNDEIIIFREEQATLQYVIELREA